MSDDVVPPKTQAGRELIGVICQVLVWNLIDDIHESIQYITLPSYYDLSAVQPEAVL